jgi:hypothetical protein
MFCERLNGKSQIKYIIVVVLLTFVNCCIVQAESIERPRPAEWENLVYGGRFMDRFLPMPDLGGMTSDVWGGDNVKPRDVNNGIEDPAWSYWGGNAKLDEDGKYHLYVCRWAENSQKGHMQWRDSEVVHAVAENSFGPYKFVDVIGPGHNPEIFLLEDGRKVIYMINGYYISDSFNGPWERKKFDFIKRDRRIIEGLSNLTFAQRQDGSYLMICRGGGVWFSKDGISPYQQVSNNRVYPAVEGRFEDPLVWKTNIQYHLIVNDWYGRIAWYLRSKDGINWKVDTGEAYLPGIAKYEDGTLVDWFKYERIKVLQDKYGRATQAHFAVIDTIKWEDLANDEHSSKMICIPLTVGRLITILDKEKITADTKTIRVKIQAEEGFDPHTDIDLGNLRFGASEEINFGRGCRVLKKERSGKDLIVTFSGQGNGFTEDNFAAKLLGKTSDGKLMFGYARLPWLNYNESALSTRLPKFIPNENGADINVEVQNFGQVSSEPSTVKIVLVENGKETQLTFGKVPALKSFEKTVVKLNCNEVLFEARGAASPIDSGQIER